MSKAQGTAGRRQLSDVRIVQLFILPTIILLILMNIFPLIYSLYLSFTSYSVITPNEPPEWVGVANYVNVLTDERFWHNFAVTGSFALASVVLQTIVGFGMALLLRQKFWGSGVVTTLILVPMMLSPIVVATFWTLILNPSYGIFNYLVAFFGPIVVYTLYLGMALALGWALLSLYRRLQGTARILVLALAGVLSVGWLIATNPLNGQFSSTLAGLATFNDLNTAPVWLGQSELALWAIVFVDVWMWSPFVMLLCLAGLSAIPEYLYEAAAIDRADWWFQFRRITLPQVMPLLLIAVLFRTIEAFKQFDLVMGLTGGGPGDVTETVSVRLYRLAFSGQFDTGQSSALAYIVLIVIIAISNLYIRALNRARGG